MPSRKCPTCGEWVFFTRGTIDIIHKCIKSSGARKTTQTDFRLIPNRINLRIDEQGWNHKGLNVRMPKKRKSRADIIDNLYNNQNVDTLVRTA